ncbi:MAG: ABC transporter ATP-binding protein [Candidatus Omnitrophica bacterium]|nr:ABC transporter ATP-binding protein [Candidatus Omnitrophota bacterium]
MISVKHLKKYFPIKKGLLQRAQGYVKAVDDISFSVAKQETLGLAGESGSGKTTTARLILNLLKADGGEILFDGEDILRLDRNKIMGIRSKMQIIFQDPFSSLNPRMRIREIIAEGITIHRHMTSKETDKSVDEVLEMVGLPSGYKSRYPHQFSGGERQRIGIARAIIVRPEFIVCDEPVSSLDVSIQAKILNLLKDLKERLKLTYIFITHDLSVVATICERVAVMHNGKIVEIGDTRTIFTNPREEYTRRLLRSIPIPDPSRRRHFNK